LAILLPFRGLLFSASRIPDLNSVVAPPYDLISPAMASELRARDPHNMIHIDLPVGTPAEKYARAAAELARWVEEGVLVRDAQPAIYALSERFTVRGMPERVRWGFFALLRIEDDEAGVVLPHEKTMDGPRSDRLELMAAARAQLSPIFVLYSDPEGSISGLVEEAAHRPADRWVSDESGMDTRLWRITDPSIQRQILGGLGQSKIWIADGHHRYAAAREVRDRIRKAEGDASRAGDRSYDYVLAYVSNIDSPGLSILPYHRLLRGIERFDLAKVLRKAASWFDVKRFSFDTLDHRAEQIRRRLREVSTRGHLAIGVYSGGTEFSLLVLRPADEEPATAQVLSDLPGPLGSLDVSVLHRTIFQEVLGLSPEEQRSGGHLRFTEEVERAIDWVDAGEGHAAFLFAPPDRRQMMAVAEAGLQMPQKSTCFYPKVLTGLIVNPFDPVGEVAHPPDGGTPREP